MRIKKKLLDYERKFLEEKDKVAKHKIAKKYIAYYRNERKEERRGYLRKKFRVETVTFGAVTGLSLGCTFKSLALIKAGFLLGVFGYDTLFSE